MRLSGKWMALALVLALIGAVSPVWAQDATAEATPEVIVLVPHTEAGFGFETVVPDGWTSAGNGAFARQSSAIDTAVIVQQSAPLNASALLTAIQPQLMLTEAPEPVGTYPGGALEWTLYQVDVTAGAVGVKVDLALAEADGTTYLVLMQAPPDGYDDLHAAVFLPTLDAFAPLSVTQEPVSYTVEDVTFANGDVTLAGTLTLPPTDGPHAVVVLVSGSGPQDRDESLGGGIAMKPFRLIADALTRAGVAVLRYDDRGVGKSTGDFGSATVSDFAADAAAAIDYLLTRADINPDQIGLLGHSEGGLVAAMLGAGDPDLDFIISMAGPSVNGRDVLLVQNRRLLEAEGATQEQIDSQVAYVEQLLNVLDDPAAMETLTYEFTLQQVQALPEEQQAAVGDIDQYAHAVATQVAQQYGVASFKSFVNYDPATDWAQTAVPVLALFGGKDVQVDAEQNAPALEAALAEAGNADYEIVVFPNANHLFQEAGTGGVSEYGSLPGEFTPDFLPTIIDWITEHVTIAQ
ncbi:MAG: alpha/beta hydrolase [Anaerolineae bacterium]|nr:alpha/beta hydrolase [Anaerolineae bacterium]